MGLLFSTSIKFVLISLLLWGLFYSLWSVYVILIWGVVLFALVSLLAPIPLIFAYPYYLSCLFEILVREDVIAFSHDTLCSVVSLSSFFYRIIIIIGESVLYFTDRLSNGSGAAKLQISLVSASLCCDDLQCGSVYYLL